jgi:hypothetical protein
MRTLLVSVLVALIAVPTLAAEFYIVQDIQKQTCTVSQEPPKNDGVTIVGEGAYNDEASAASDMTKMLACNPREASSGGATNPVGSTKQ